MKIAIVTPAPARSTKGNRVTAVRWARILGELGHRVSILGEYDRQSCDAVVALHARRSHRSIERFHRRHPDRPLIVALTGTDLYRDMAHSAKTRRSLELASRLVVLQRLAISGLPRHLRSRARVIHQSVNRTRAPVAPSPRWFEVCVIGHLRRVKDPFRTARAARLLPPSSRIRVLHLGDALSRDMERRAADEERGNRRYRWLGGQPAWKTFRILRRSRLLVLSSVLEGGANVISEAIAASTPVLASRIPGSIGMLGAAYPGYFPVGDTRALASLLERAEADSRFYRRLHTWIRRLVSLVDPARELRRWNRLLKELFN